MSDPSDTVFVGVNFVNQGGAAVVQQAMPVSSTSYGAVSFDIHALPGAVKAVVFVWKNGGSGFAYVDEAALGQVGASPP